MIPLEYSYGFLHGILFATMAITLWCLITNVFLCSTRKVVNKIIKDIKENPDQFKPDGDEIIDNIKARL